MNVRTIRNSLIIITGGLILFGLGVLTGCLIYQPAPISVPYIVEKPIPYEVVIERTVPVFIRDTIIVPYEITTPEVISVEEGLNILYEGRDSHIIFKAALEAGLVEETAWTGGIAFQDEVIERYNKVLDLMMWMSNRIMVMEIADE